MSRFMYVERLANQSLVVLFPIFVFIKDCPALKVIVSNCEYLIAISKLTAVVELTKLLVEQFHCKFTRHQAENMSIQEFCEEHFRSSSHAIHQLVQDVIKASQIIVQQSHCETLIRGFFFGAEFALHIGHILG